MVFKEDIEAAYNGQKQVLARDVGLINRNLLNTIKPFSSHIEVISGVRRSGKSTLMRQIVKKYFGKVAYFNFEDSRVFGFGLGDFSKLDEVMGDEIEAYFFDEIQNVEGWEI